MLCDVGFMFHWLLKCKSWHFNHPLSQCKSIFALTKCAVCNARSLEVFVVPVSQC